MNIGVNCFGMRVPFYEGFESAIAELKEIGISEIEPCVLFPSEPDAMPKFPEDGSFSSDFILSSLWEKDIAVEKISTLRSHGFLVQCIHAMSYINTPEYFISLIPSMISFTKENNIKYIVFSPMKNAEQIKPLLGAYREASEKLDEVGVKFLIHTHEHECYKINGVSALDLLIKECPKVGIELDVGWAKFAGADVIELMKELGDRLPIVHLKDIKADASVETRDTCFTAIGEGSIPLDEIIKLAVSMGIPSVIMDQDDSEGRMLDDVRIGTENIKRSL